MANNVLCIMHDLEPMGASLAFVNVLNVLREQGISVVVIAMKDGSLRTTVEELQIPIIIQEDFLKDYQVFLQQAGLFDLIIVNSLVAFTAIHVLKFSRVRVLWWIHESGKFILDNTNILPDFAQLPENITVFANGPLCQEDIRKAYGIHVDVLPLGVPDEGMPNHFSHIVTDRIVVGNVGTYALLKGQDVLIDAYKSLCDEEQERCNVVLVGKDDAYHPEIVPMVHEFAEKYANAELCGWVGQDELFEKMNDWDVVVVPSRLDSLSAVAIEAMAMGIPVICSDACGISRYVQDGVDGWIFQSENVVQLKEILREILENPERLRLVGEQGRKVYEKFFSRRQLAGALAPHIL